MVSAPDDADGTPRPAVADGGWLSPRLTRAFVLCVLLAVASICAQGLWRANLWKSAEPRVMDTARDQYTQGLVRSLTFAGMPFLEKPPLYFDLTAVAFHLGGGPSIPAARVVVALLAMLWVASAMLLVRRADGSHAALLAGALVAVAPGFVGLTRRLGVDIALVAMLSLSLLLLFVALRAGGQRVGGRWWWACLAAAGLAALSKGPFGTFLFVMPTLTYALVFRERALLRALFRPASLALLLLPHVLWGLVLYRDGGLTFLFEHFVNNTVGRVLHSRFDVAGAHDLAYGDVGVVYPWSYYLRTIPGQAMPAMLCLPFAVMGHWRRGGFRARDDWSRLFHLALCWGCVPPLLLSFSSYKGKGHLGASTIALVIAGGLWLARRLPRLGAGPPARGVLFGVMALYAVVPALLVAAGFGLPASRAGVIGVWSTVGVAGVALCWAALRLGARTLAVYAVLAMLAAGMLADFAPGNNIEDDARNTVDPVAIWVASEVGELPLAIFVPQVFQPKDEHSRDPVGRTNEQELAALWYWLERPPVRLRSPDAVWGYLRAETPGYVLVARPRQLPVDWPQTEPGVGWLARADRRDRSFTLIANRAAARLKPGPGLPAPSTPLPR